MSEQDVSLGATNGTADLGSDPFVGEYAGVCGGYPVIRDTRIPVRLVVGLAREGASIEELAATWPTVTPDQIRGALAYYARHPRRTDEDVARHAAAWRAAHGAPWPA